MTKPDLAKFASPGKKLSWERRRALIEENFPDIVKLDWKKAFDEDIDLFAAIMRDIIKIDAATPGRSGPKPAVSAEEGFARFRQLNREDFSMLPFVESLSILAAGLSVTTLSRKINMSRANTFRLLRGEKSPTIEEFIQIAKAFKKEPGYFSDYRSAIVAAAIFERLARYPESSVKWYTQLGDIK